MPIQSTEEIRQVMQKRDRDQPEFQQAVIEVLESLQPVFEEDPRYLQIFERLIEPERVIQFRVAWLDDNGQQQVNRGFRVQYNSAIGPYKGGIRFHPSVNMSVLKFLGFEQILKNALTTLPMGGAKGGADFDPKGRSDAEVMRFCQSFVTELYRHVGQFTDIPAGDIGVGAREIGYMFGQYKRLTGHFEGVLTGKGLSWGGSCMRPEATGYGAVYFLQEMLREDGQELGGKTILLSGSGNVAQYACQKLIELGATCCSLSDSNGTVVEPSGFTAAQLAQLMDIKNRLRGRCADYARLSPSAQYHADKRPWEVFTGTVDAIMPCATQNEVNAAQAARIAKLGCRYVVEGANMPSEPGAIQEYRAAGIRFGPAKAANAGGVAVSGLEMAQNSQRLHWDAARVDSELHSIMSGIFRQCRDTAAKYGRPGDYQFGANVAGFLKVAGAMSDQGCV